MILTAQSAPAVERSHISALMQAIHGAEIFVLYQTPDLVYQWAENLPAVIANKWFAGCRDSDFLPERLSKSMETAKLQVLAKDKMQTIEARFENSSKQVLWYKFSIDCHHDDQGKVIGILTTGVNVSELRRREQVLKALLREVSHRSKNLLAIIQSVAGQTARYTDSLPTFLKKFQGRIQSLSHSQDLVTDSDWRGAHFRELFLSQASGYLGKDSNRFIIEGEDPYLFPGAALHIGLAFHELIINSLSYGALSQENGLIRVISKVEKCENRPSHLSISWYEVFAAGSLQDNNRKACFGSAVLEKIVPVSVNGTASLEFTDDGVAYHLTLPDTYFDFYY
ncbi:sensor histidine kinase [uncultured Bartonella sp.]|uniref:PAS domain-containing sensor histidine kinase n=1 Tax=uncultured Bartonella sp. TaxID=104108 RepID=UPI002633F1AB|nr:sensor histidine kinase [uncultured Bartonella sp.]